MENWCGRLGVTVLCDFGCRSDCHLDRHHSRSGRSRRNRSAGHHHISTVPPKGDLNPYGVAIVPAASVQQERSCLAMSW